MVSDFLHRNRRTPRRARVGLCRFGRGCDWRDRTSQRRRAVDLKYRPSSPFGLSEDSSREMGDDPHLSVVDVNEAEAGVGWRYIARGESRPGRDRGGQLLAVGRPVYAFLGLGNRELDAPIASITSQCLPSGDQSGRPPIELTRRGCASGRRSLSQTEVLRTWVRSCCRQARSRTPAIGIEAAFVQRFVSRSMTWGP